MPEREVVCQEVVELITDLLDGALPAEQLDLVEEHLVFCDWCRDHVDHVQAAIRATGTLADEPEPVPAELLDTLIAAFTGRGEEE